MPSSPEVRLRRRADQKDCLHAPTGARHRRFLVERQQHPLRFFCELVSYALTPPGYTVGRADDADIALRMYEETMKQFSRLFKSLSTTPFCFPTGGWGGLLPNRIGRLNENVGLLPLEQPRLIPDDLSHGIGETDSRAIF